MTQLDRVLTRTEAQQAVVDLGWRYLLGELFLRVDTTSLAHAAELATRAIAAAGQDADDHLWTDLRPNALTLRVQTIAVATLTARDIEIAHAVSTALAPSATRPAQLIEIGLDALDIVAVRPFWKAILGYGDEAHRTGPKDPLVDPYRHGPAIWFQQMDAPRTQRNRMHLDISVPHDEAKRRVEAALAAGGVLVSDRGPAFWVLADPEGNEACVTTWQGRDP